MRKAILFALPLALALAAAGHASVVLDRVAVVVGSRVVKTSDIERDLRVAEFLNRQPLDLSEAARRKSIDRLVEQELIREDVANGGYSMPSAADVDKFVQQLQRDRFGGSATQMNAGLAKYGITPAQFRRYLEWQLTVLRFIDERFRPGVLVTDEDVQSYYDQHRAQFPGPLNDAATERIRELLTGERVNQAFEEWLDQTKRRTRIEYRVGEAEKK